MIWPNLTHICPLNFSILINWTRPFPNLRVSCVLFSFLFYFKSKQCRPWSDATFCTIYGMLGTYGLNRICQLHGSSVCTDTKPKTSLVSRNPRFDRLLWVQHHQKYSNMRICHINTTNIKSFSFINDWCWRFRKNTQSLVQFCSFPVQAFMKFHFCLGGWYYIFCKTNTLFRRYRFQFGVVCSAVR